MNTGGLTYIGSISVVVPVYNSEDSLPELIGHLEKSLCPQNQGIYFFSIDLVQDFRKDRNEFIDITGWAFIAGQTLFTLRIMSLKDTLSISTHWITYQEG